MSNIGKEFRLAEFFDKKDGRTIILDTSPLASVGQTEPSAKILDNLNEVVEQLDALIVNAGQMTRLVEQFKGKPLMTRLDWSNLFRSAPLRRGGDETRGFALPPADIKHTPLATPDEVFALGATAAVGYLLFGYDEEMESKMIEYISGITRTCYKLGLPLLVDVYPTGPKISQANFDNSVKLASAMMQEAGVDGLIIPPTTKEMIKELLKFIKIPILVRVEHKKDTQTFIELGCQGVALTLETPIKEIAEIRKIVHS